MTKNINIKNSDSPILICYGAEHTLTIDPKLNNSWVNHHVCIQAPTGQELPFQTTPEPGEGQILLASGCSWKLKCPQDGEETTFKCLLSSEFTAEPYWLRMQLGHFDCKFGNTRSSLPAEIEGDEVEIYNSVVSIYTEKMIEGVKVQWRVNGLLVLTDKTTAAGISRLKHVFPKSGEYEVAASFKNKYNDKIVEHTYKITIYEENPWKSVKVKVDDVPHLWGSPLVLNYEKTSIVTLEAEPEIARKLMAELVDVVNASIDISPKDWQDPVGGVFQITMTPQAARGGWFTLVFLSREVKLPFLIDGRVTSRDLANEADLEINGKRVSFEGNVFFRDLPYNIKLVPKVGSAIANLPATLTYKITSGLVDVKLDSRPDFGEENKDQNWDISGSGSSGLFELILSCWGVQKSIVLTDSLMISSSINEEGDIKLDKNESDIFLRGEKRTLSLIPKPESPLAHIDAALRWVSGVNIAKADVTCNPNLDVMSRTKTWDITPSAKKSGAMVFDLILNGSVNPTTLTTYTVVSANHFDEVDVELDDKPVVPGTKFTAGQQHELSLIPKANSPYAYMPARLKWGGSTSLVAADFSCLPSFGTPGMRFKWDIQGDLGRQGKFDLEVEWVQLPNPMRLPNLELQ